MRAAFVGQSEVGERGSLLFKRAGLKPAI